MTIPAFAFAAATIRSQNTTRDRVGGAADSTADVCSRS
jgi:hypothetical protein